MKKNFSFTLLMLFLMFFSFVIFPAKVFGAGSDKRLLPSEWFNHISEFSFGFAKGEVNSNGDIDIVEEPSYEYDGWFINYSWWHYTSDNPYFEPRLYGLASIIMNNGNVLSHLNQNYEDFDGYFYWNFEEKYWQIEYYATSELDYYKQRVEDLEDEIQDLENEIGLLEDEIQDLENEIQELQNENHQLENEIQELQNEKQQLENEIQELQNENQQLENEIQELQNENQQLENEIQELQNEKQQLENEIQELQNENQQLEDALDLEYDRGYNDGYEIGYTEGLSVENNDIDIIKWFVPLVVIIFVVGIFESINIFRKRRDE